MIATGRIDLVASTRRYIYVMELKLSNNGGTDSAAKQIVERKYLEPFAADNRCVTGIAVELDEEGRGLLGWQIVDLFD